MSLFTSSDFASTCADGKDWRECAKNVLDKLEDVRTNPDAFNVGFLYVTDHLADDISSILNLFKSVLQIENWVGTVGMGVVGCGESIIDRPAISAMIGNLPSDSFCIFPQEEEFKDQEETQPLNADEFNQAGAVSEWLKINIPFLSLIHANPMTSVDLHRKISQFGQQSGSFVIGGVASSRNHFSCISNIVQEEALSGIMLSSEIPASTMLSQGGAPISPIHTITKADNTTILEIDNKRALDVFQEELRTLAAKKLGKSSEDFIAELHNIQSSDQIPEEFQNLFQGHIHVGLPLVQSDQKDYLVRDITHIDMDEGSISISENIGTGDRLLLVERNNDTVAADLSNSLVALRKRVQAERNSFAPKAAIYISCIARGFNAPKKQKNYEMQLIQDIIGDVPLTGFYAGGEINNARLYGYSGILTLFF